MFHHTQFTWYENVKNIEKGVTIFFSCLSYSNCGVVANHIIKKVGKAKRFWFVTYLSFIYYGESYDKESYDKESYDKEIQFVVFYLWYFIRFIYSYK